VCAPKLWNSLLLELRKSTRFKKELKTGYERYINKVFIIVIIIVHIARACFIDPDSTAQSRHSNVYKHKKKSSLDEMRIDVIHYEPHVPHL